MAGVYISYPFCRQKCTYCNFASAAGAAELERQYRDALRGEILGHRWEWKSETLYLGGGSPSKLAGEELAGLLEPLPATRWREATIEVAPGDVTAEKAREWRHAGLTRVSLGVQSFVAAELRRTGRKHSAQTVAADIALLRREGFA